MQTEAMTHAGRPATIRSKVSNGTRLLAGVDGRSSTARRFRDLIAELTAEAGGAEGLSAAERGAIRQGAAIMLRAEQVQGQIVRGEPVDNDTLIRLSGEARRVLAGVRKRNAEQSSKRTLADYAREKAAERT
jgi:hypothetical protein